MLISRPVYSTLLEQPDPPKADRLHRTWSSRGDEVGGGGCGAERRKETREEGKSDKPSLDVESGDHCSAHLTGLS